MKNLKEKKHISLKFKAGDEQRQLIKSLDKKFNTFLTKFLPFLNDILNSLNKKKEGENTA